MNNSILRQFDPSQAQIILGTMSGTSLDGLDLALCEIRGRAAQTQIKLLKHTTLPYADEFRKEIQKVYAKELVPLEVLCRLHQKIAQVHAQGILDTLGQWSINLANLTCIASHGQTIFHAPPSLYPGQEAATLQIGDADFIAMKTGIPVLSDFRQKQIAAGGEGAPLALYADALLFAEPSRSRVMLNLGGISNFTYLPAGYLPGEILATDTGPANRLSDLCVQQNIPGLFFDEAGIRASRGKVMGKWLQAMLEHPFFAQGLPKTTGPETFNEHFLKASQEKAGLLDLSLEDQLATLNQLTAQSIADAIFQLHPRQEALEIYVSGGGWHNLDLMKKIREIVKPYPVYGFDVLGIPSDAKEAVLMALLAHETLLQSRFQPNKSPGKFPGVCMGKISLPY